MRYEVKKAVVIGAGTMGAAIAAHLANIRVSVTLLDIVPESHARGGFGDNSLRKGDVVKPHDSGTALEQVYRYCLGVVGGPYVSDETGPIEGASKILRGLPVRPVAGGIPGHLNPSTNRSFRNTRLFGRA